MLDAQRGHSDEPSCNFLQSLALRPEYAIALANLGNLYRREGKFAEAEKFLTRALELEPDNPEVNYNLGMLYARQSKSTAPRNIWNRPRPYVPTIDALNNPCVLFVREKTIRGGRKI
jgi:Flp pilus assembly protein TadD